MARVEIQWRLVGLVAIWFLLLNNYDFIEAASEEMAKGQSNENFIESQNMLGSFQSKQTLLTPANPYTRGCNPILRCRNGPPPSK